MDCVALSLAVVNSVELDIIALWVLCWLYCISLLVRLGLLG